MKIKTLTKRIIGWSIVAATFIGLTTIVFIEQFTFFLALIISAGMWVGLALFLLLIYWLLISD